MAFGKAAVSLIFAGFIGISAAEFPVRHAHLRKGCDGTLTVGGTGISFAGLKGHTWKWNYEDIQELRLSSEGIRILTYQDRRLRAGADRAFEFEGRIPAAELWALWKQKLDQRLVAEIAEPVGDPVWSAPVKHLRTIAGTEGVLAFHGDAVIYRSAGKDDSHTWRYRDIESISSSGPFDLTITSLERSGRQYRFQLKQPITEARYNQLWLEIERKNGKIQ